MTYTIAVAGKSGVSLVSLLPADRQPLKYAGEAKQFTALAA